MRKCAGGSRKSPKIVIYVYSAVCMNLSIPSLEPTFLLGGILPDFFVVAQSPCCVWLFETPGYPHHLPEFAQVHVHCISYAIQPSHPLMPSSPSVLNLSQHQRLFQWVSCSHQISKYWSFNYQQKSFKRIFRVNFPWDWLVWSLCSPEKWLSGVVSSTTVWKHQ